MQIGARLRLVVDMVPAQAQTVCADPFITAAVTILFTTKTANTAHVVIVGLEGKAMRVNSMFPPRLRTSVVRFHHPFALLGGALLCVFPIAVCAQRVSFAGSTPSVNFGNVNLCQTGKTTPAPCSETLTLTYNVTGSGTLGPPNVVTGGAPNLDFTLSSGSTCTGSVIQGNSCKVNVKFAPLYAGSRVGGVQITDGVGKVLATTLVYGVGDGPQAVFGPNEALNLPSYQPPLPEEDYLGMAVDAASDLFVTYTDYNGLVLELTNTGTQISHTVSSTSYTYGVAVDGAGDIFVSLPENNQVVELPAGGGPQITLPFGALDSPTSLVIDAAGDLFGFGGNPPRIVELPVGSNTPIGAPYLGLGGLMAVDAAGDVFAITLMGDLVELPAGGAPITIDNVGCAEGLAVDGVGNLYAAIYACGGVPYANTILEYPVATRTRTSLANVGYPFSLGVTPPGDFFVQTNGNITAMQRSQSPPLSFNAIAYGTTTTLPLTITNAGNKELTMTASFNSPSFTLVSSQPADCPTGTAAGQNCTLQIQFSPSAVGVQNGQLTLQTNGPTNPAVSLQGTSVVFAPVLSLASGVYSGPQTVSINDETPEAAIYYTTNGKTPTASSTLYSGPISVSSTERITAIAIAARAPSPVATAAYTITSTAPPEVINFGPGFANSQESMQFNGSAALDGSGLQLTSSKSFQAGSAFYATPLNIQSFTTAFAFQLTSPNADGITFTIQNAGATALGNVGASLGYAPIGKSVAIKFDLHNNAGEGPNSTGLYIDGALPTVPALDLTGTGINLHNGDSILAQITYDGTNLKLTLTDMVNLSVWSHSFAVNIPAAVGSNTAYAGFTGGTGADSAKQEILSWTYAPGSPGSLPPSPAPPTTGPVPNYPAGFVMAGMTTNGNASLTGTALQLTDGGQYEASSAFYSTPVNVQSFTTDFTLLQNGAADGLTFAIQNAGLNALGNRGKSLGYAPIGSSVAFKFDLYNNAGEGYSSVGLYTDGAVPTIPAINISDNYPAINLFGGDVMHVHMTYDGTNLNVTLTDTVALGTASFSFPIDIPATVGGNTAYVGFTGATGAQTAIQQILTWTFTNP